MAIPLMLPLQENSTAAFGEPESTTLNTRVSVVVVCSFSLIVCSVTGCGNDMARVSGRVTVDGEPLRSGEEVRATIQFVPEDGTGAPAAGLLDSSGQYSLSTGATTGLAPGNYLVSISASQLIGKEQVGVPRSGKRITPAHYGDPSTSGFRVAVEPGNNTYDFALESDSRSSVSRNTSGR